MSRYLLQARCLTGPLCEPTRNDTRIAEGDDWDTLDGYARELVEDGFTIWIFELDPALVGPGNAGYRSRAVHSPVTSTER